MVNFNKDELLKEMNIMSNSFARALEIKSEYLETLKKRFDES